MENLYKVNEYSGKLPNPKSFPIQGAIIVAVKDRPYTFADGFMVDLSVREADKEMLVGKAIRTIKASDLADLIEEAKRSEILLSEPEFISDITYPAYVVFTPESNPVIIQVKYYKYFQDRYPDCKFYKRNEGSILIAIKVNEEVVGLCMRMFYSELSLTKIKEERK